MKPEKIRKYFPRGSKRATALTGRNHGMAMEKQRAPYCRFPAERVLANEAVQPHPGWHRRLMDVPGRESMGMHRVAEAVEERKAVSPGFYVTGVAKEKVAKAFSKVTAIRLPHGKSRTAFYAQLKST